MTHLMKCVVVFIFIIAVFTEQGIAGLILKNDYLVTQPAIQKKTKKPATRSIKKSPIHNANQLGTKRSKKRWHQLNGNLNGNDVFLYVKKNKYRQITGYLINHAGQTEYIYGEWYKDHLQIYDQSNQLLTVILNH